MVVDYLLPKALQAVYKGVVMGVIFHISFTTVWGALDLSFSPLRCVIASF